MKKYLISIFSVLLLLTCVSCGVFYILNDNLITLETPTQSTPPDNDDVTQNAPTNDDLWTASGNYATSFAGGSGTEDDPYQIATAEELAYLAYLVNGSSTSSYRGLYFKQTANIDLSAHYWDAIGYSSSRYFSGYYDGGGYAISGLFTQSGSSSTYNYQGLFGYVRGMSSSDYAIIKNVTIGEDSVIQGYQYVGGIVGYCYNYSNIFSVDINNCINNGTVIGSYRYIGGISGYQGTITNCCNYGTIEGEDGYVGGIVGNSGVITNCYNYGAVEGVNNYVGGISGLVGTIANCYNYGTIEGVNNYVGGIIGSGDATSCVNYGAINGIERIGGITGYGGATNCINYGITTGNMYVGGIAGYAQNDDLTYCINYGDVNGRNTVGGILGCYYSETLVTDSINFGNISGTGMYIGGIIGQLYLWNVNVEETHVERCFNKGNVLGQDCVGGVVGSVSKFSGDEYTYYLHYLSDCYNSGDLKSSDDGANVGGIVGDLYLDRTRSSMSINFYISNCYNKGNIDAGNGNAGGIIGYNGNYSSTLRMYNCFNAGSLSGDGYVGAIVGYSNNSETGVSGGPNEEGTSYYYNCYYGVNCESTSVVGYSAVGNDLRYSCGSMTENEATSESWYTTNSNWRSNFYWDFDTVWSIVDGVNDNYPILTDNYYSITSIAYHSNFGDDEIAGDYNFDGTSLTILENMFTREDYIFTEWNTKADGSGMTYEPGDVFENGGLVLYAQWMLPIYEITLDWGGIIGGTPNVIYQWYGDGYYREESCVNMISSLTIPADNGFTFRGFYTGLNGLGTQVVDANGNFLSTTTEIHTWHAYFIANNPAHYDSTGDYWYVENGYMPQSRVTNTTTSTYLSTNWNSLSNGSVYYMDGIGDMQSKVYNGNEYCEYNGKYYLVEPIRWRLQASSNQQTGYGTTTDTLAVMDTIVYVGRYSESAINEGDGYSTTAVGYLDNNQIDEHYLVSWTESMPTYGTTSLYGTSEDFTSYIFVSSIEEIESVAGDYTIKFSDLASDYLTDTGADLFYYTRNLGTNINNIVCLSIDGDVTQKKPNLNFLGVQFTITVSEYGCV